MDRRTLFAAASFTALALAGLTGAIAFAKDDKKDKKEVKLPPGWTEADMEACSKAAAPGKMHEHLARDAGVWEGKNTMWMGAGAEPTTTECKSTLTAILDGRFVRCEMAGEMPGMGPYHGLSINGYDNVSQEFVSTWIDNCGTGMALGKGQLSPDGKTLTWKYTYNCPVQKKPTVMRSVETATSPTAKVIEMFAPDVKTGKEYKMMRLELAKVK